MVIALTGSTELFEKKFPGLFIGKAVVDKDAKYVGVVKSLKFTFPEAKLSILIQGINSQGRNIELEVPIEKINAVGNIVKVSESFENIRSMNERDIILIRREIQNFLYKKKA